MSRTGGRFLLSLPLTIALLVFFLFSGCARRSPFDMGLGPIHGPEDIVQRINANARRLSTLRAEVRINSSHMAKSRLVKVSVLFARPSQYKMKFGALFGMTMAIMMVSGEDVDLYVPQSNRLYRGQLSAESLGQIIGLDMSLPELMETLVGNIRLPAVSQLLEYRPEEERYALSFQVPGGRQDVQVASDGLRLLRVELCDSRGQSLVVKTFRDHRMLGGVVRPGQVELSLPNKDQKIALTFIQQEVNQQLEESDFRLDLPATVEPVPLYLE